MEQHLRRRNSNQTTSNGAEWPQRYKEETKSQEPKSKQKSTEKVVVQQYSPAQQPESTASEGAERLIARRVIAGKQPRAPAIRAPRSKPFKCKKQKAKSKNQIKNRRICYASSGSPAQPQDLHTHENLKRPTKLKRMRLLRVRSNGNPRSR